MSRSCPRPSQPPPLCPVFGSTQHQDGASAPCMPSLPPSHPTPLGLPRTGAGPPHRYSFSCPESPGPLWGDGVWGVGGGRVGGVWNRGSGFRLRELSAGQACEADLTLSSQRVAICSSDPVQPTGAREGRDGFPEAWFWLHVWAKLSRPAAGTNWPCWPLPAPPSVCHPRSHRVSWARSACHGNSSHHSSAALTQEAEKSGLAVGALCLKVETTWGPPTCLEEAAPRRTACF